MAESDDLSCREAVEQFSDLIERFLPAESVRRFEAHLAECPGCAEYLAQLRTTIGLLGRYIPPEAEQEVRDRLVAMFRSMPS